MKFAPGFISFVSSVSPMRSRLESGVVLSNLHVIFCAMKRKSFLRRFIIKWQVRAALMEFHEGDKVSLLQKIVEDLEGKG